MRQKVSGYKRFTLLVISIMMVLSFVGCTTDNGNIINSLGGQSSNSSSSLLNKDVEKKADEIQEIIDGYFYFEADEENITENVYKGMMEGLDDPYSVYYTKEEYAKLQEETSGEYVGIGVQVSQDPETKIITMVKPFKNSPATEAGIKKGDILVAVDDLELSGEEVSEVVKLIKGEEGTVVKIKVYREGESDYLTFDVTRRKVENPTVEYEMLDNNVGYISVSEFYDVTANQYKAAVEELKAQGMKGLIVDLRDNPGGLLTAVVDMLDYMLPEGKIVYTEDKDGNIISEYSSTDKEKFELPLVVLANEYSASASEIFTGAIKDYGIGTIVGKQTYGKGIVQRLFELKDGSAVKVTIAKYFTPNGNDIHKIGVEPDVEVDLSEEAKKEVDLSKEDDNQLQKAIEIIQENIQ